MKRCLGSGRILPPAGFEPATPSSEVGSANRSATRTLLQHTEDLYQNEEWPILNVTDLLNIVIKVNKQKSPNITPVFWDDEK